MPATRNAVSYKRLLETQLRAEVEELFALNEQSEQPEVLDGLVVREEIARRQDRLVRLTEAKAVLEPRAGERVAAEQAEYEAKLAQCAERERTTGRRPGGRSPTLPVPGAHSGDQYNFTDPESHIMKNPTNAGFEQDYNVQLAVDQGSLLIVGWALSTHPNDSQEAEPTFAAISTALGTRRGQQRWTLATLAPRHWRHVPSGASSRTSRRGVIPIIPSSQQRFAPLPEDASSQVKMVYKLKTALGKAIYGARKYTVEPVIGIIKEVLGFRQFS